MLKVMKLGLLLIGLCLGQLALAADMIVKVDINHADAEELSTVLAGIGEKRAQAIIDYRATHEPFKTADDLTKIKGIGEKTVEKNRDRIIIGEVKTVAEKPATTETEPEPRTAATPKPPEVKAMAEAEPVVEKTATIKTEPEPTKEVASKTTATSAENSVTASTEEKPTQTQQPTTAAMPDKQTSTTLPQ